LRNTRRVSAFARLPSVMHGTQYLSAPKHKRTVRSLSRFRLVFAFRARFNRREPQSPTSIGGYTNHLWTQN
jgi:hypothetical protein